MTIKQLKITTVSYLILPNLIFVVTWLNPLWATISLVVSIYSFYSFIKHTKQCFEENSALRFEIMPQKVTLYLAIFTLILGIFFSLGNFGFGQSYDYFKHNTIVKELIEKSFPVVYENETRYGVLKEPAILGYYMAYYLPTAIICKFIGVGFANILLFIWGGIGIFISFCWLYFLTPKNLNILLVILLFLLGATLFKPYLYAHYLLKNIVSLPMIQYFIWPSGISFNLINIHYSPQHYIVTTVGVFFVYYECFIRKDNRFVLFFVSLLLMWSFLGAFSVGIITAFLVIFRRFKNFFGPENIIGGGVITFIMASYFLAHFQDNRYSGFIWTFADISGYLYQKPLVSILALIGYCIFEIGVYLFFMFKVFSQKSTNKEKLILLFFCAAYFIISPLYRIGYNNDLAMRLISTIKILVFILVLSAYSEMLTSKISTKFLRLYMAFTIILGIFSSLTTLKWDNVPNIANSPNINKADIPQEIFLQYFAKKNSFFGNHLMKEVKSK
ncbi:hypothetical protein EMA8858_01363 [Emticicia aquatica]|uniref:Uncharacterized protein n=1 Tax=Emticicia aquatica TaxID=1681835 RepID=A0ABM9AN52_9BACT|nr:hypothetical protein [Emticicia aquatica]CAH0995243.1 hypothetical protein EMA8858_01363 [Emticicia aquatica]